MRARLVRSHGRMIAGVCAGIAEYFGWSARDARIGCVLLSVLSAGFPGILVYLILWMVMPPADPHLHDFGIQ
jgi:phage shock protein PspC (stress-responsive transcriptional regulator)